MGAEMKNIHGTGFLSLIEEEATSIQHSDTNATNPTKMGMDESVIHEAYRNLSLEMSDKDISILELDNTASAPVKPFKYGFIGLTKISFHIIKSFIASGCPVVLWNNTDSGYSGSVVGACNAITPSHVVNMANIIIVSSSGESEMKLILHQINCFINHDTGFVDLVSHENSLPENFVENICCQGGRYLQIHTYGGVELAKKGLLTLAACGNKTLFDECADNFAPVAKKVLYTGGIEELPKINLVVKYMHGIILSGISEGLALAKHAGLPLQVLFEVMNLTSSVSQKLLADAKVIIENIYSEDLFLSLLKDVHKGLELGDELEFNLPVGTVSKEVLKTMNIMNLKKRPHLYSLVDKKKQSLFKPVYKKRKGKKNLIYDRITKT